MLYEIKHLDGRVIATKEGDTLALALQALASERAVLRGAVLRDAVLRGAVLRDAVLTDAVLRGIPTVDNLHSEMLKAIEAGGSLEMVSWHTCETTHCRAGWAITLAGAAGKALESSIGPAAAGALITLRSCPWMERVPNFYANNEAAMVDIKACAEREKAEAAK